MQRVGKIVPPGFSNNNYQVKLYDLDFEAKKLLRCVYSISDQDIAHCKIPTKESKWIKSVGLSIIKLIKNEDKFYCGGNETDIYIYLKGELIFEKNLEKYENPTKKTKLISLLKDICRGQKSVGVASKPCIRGNYSYIVKDIGKNGQEDFIMLQDSMQSDTLVLTLRDFLTKFNRLIVNQFCENLIRNDLILSNFKENSWTSVKFDVQNEDNINFLIKQRDRNTFTMEKFEQSALKIILVKDFNDKLELKWIKSSQKDVVTFRKNENFLGRYYLWINVELKDKNTRLLFLAFSKLKLNNFEECNNLSTLALFYGIARNIWNEDLKSFRDFEQKGYEGKFVSLMEFYKSRKKIDLFI